MAKRPASSRTSSNVSKFNAFVIHGDVGGALTVHEEVCAAISISSIARANAVSRSLIHSV